MSRDTFGNSPSSFGPGGWQGPTNRTGSPDSDCDSVVRGGSNAHRTNQDAAFRPDGQPPDADASIARCAAIVTAHASQHCPSTDQQQRFSGIADDDNSPRLEHYSADAAITPHQQYGSSPQQQQQYGQQASETSPGGSRWSVSTAMPGHQRCGSQETVDMAGYGGSGGGTPTTDAGAFAAGAFAAGAFGMATASNTAHLGAPLSYAAAAAAVSGAAAFPTFRKQRFSRALSDVLHKADGAAASDGEATELEPATPRAVDVASAGSPSPFTNHYEPPSLLTQSKDALRSHRRAPLERRGGGAAGRRDVRNTSSIFRGVTKHRRTHRWEAHIWTQKKQVYLGGFEEEGQAGRAHDVMALKCRGEDGPLNRPAGEYAPLRPLLDSLTTEEVVALLRQESKSGGSPKPPAAAKPARRRVKAYAPSARGSGGGGGDGNGAAFAAQHLSPVPPPSHPFFQVASPHAYTAPQQAWDYAHTPSGGAAMGLHAYPSAANFSHTPSQLSKLLMQAPLPQTLGEIQLWQQAQAQQQQQQQQYGGSVSFGGDGGGGGASGSGLGGSRPSHQQKSNSLSLSNELLPSIEESRSATPALLPFDTSTPNPAAALLAPGFGGGGFDDGFDPTAAAAGSLSLGSNFGGGGIGGGGGNGGGGGGPSQPTDLFDILDDFKEPRDFWPSSCPAGSLVPVPTMTADAAGFLQLSPLPRIGSYSNLGNLSTLLSALGSPGPATTAGAAHGVGATNGISGSGGGGAAVQGGAAATPAPPPAAAAPPDTYFPQLPGAQMDWLASSGF